MATIDIKKLVKYLERIIPSQKEWDKSDILWYIQTTTDIPLKEHQKIAESIIKIISVLYPYSLYAYYKHNRRCNYYTDYSYNKKGIIKNIFTATQTIK